MYLRGKLHSDRCALSVFNTERPHNSISISLQTAHFEHGVNTNNAKFGELSEGR